MKIFKSDRYSIHKLNYSDAEQITRDKVVHLKKHHLNYRVRPLLPSAIVSHFTTNKMLITIFYIFSPCLTKVHFKHTSGTESNFKPHLLITLGTHTAVCCLFLTESFPFFKSHYFPIISCEHWFTEGWLKSEQINDRSGCPCHLHALILRQSLFSSANSTVSLSLSVIINPAQHIQ